MIGQVVPTNPATSVRGPTHVVKTGKTPVLQPAEARQLLDAIDTSTLPGLRDRALLAVMVYSFARVSAVVGMRVEDYYQQGKRWWLRLQEKGGKHHAVPVHHKAEAYLDAYLAAAGIAAEKDAPLWRSMPRAGGMGARRMSRVDVFRMIKRRVKTVGLGEANCHTFRATGITAYLLNGGTLERAQAIAAHESPRTDQALRPDGRRGDHRGYREDRDLSRAHSLRTPGASTAASGVGTSSIALTPTRSGSVPISDGTRSLPPSTRTSSRIKDLHLGRRENCRHAIAQACLLSLCENQK